MGWTPSIVPRDDEGRTFYLVIEQHARSGYFPETMLANADLETLIADLIAGQYGRPLEVVAFNPTEGWSRNVTVDVAEEVRRRADWSGTSLSSSVAEFVERSARPDRQLSLRLA